MYKSEFDEYGQPPVQQLNKKEATDLLLLFKQQGALLSLWRVFGLQCVFWLSLVLMAMLFKPNWASNVAYGGLAVCLPACVFAFGLSKSTATPMYFLRHELLKLFLTIVLLSTAPKWLTHVNWWILVASFILILKVQMLAILWLLHVQQNNKEITFNKKTDTDTDTNTDTDIDIVKSELKFKKW